MPGDGRSQRNQRDYRKALAEETVEVLTRGWYVTDSSDEPVDVSVALERAKQASQELQGTTPLGRGDGSKRDSATLRIQVTDETSLQALYRLAEEAPEELSSSMLLNFASAKNPGGGFLGGAQAQEESLARSSGLFPCLEQFTDSLYARNRRDPNGCLYSDDMIFSPDVPFFRTDEGSFLDRPVCCSVLTAPAPNAGAAKGSAVKEVAAVLKARVLRVLRVAKAQSLRTLILGAWGCGVFKNDPQEVAISFSHGLDLPEFRGAFDYVLFPIPDPKMKEQFERVLRPAVAAVSKAAAKSAAKAAAKAPAQGAAERAERAETADRAAAKAAGGAAKAAATKAEVEGEGQGTDIAEDAPKALEEASEACQAQIHTSEEEEVADPAKASVEFISFGYCRGAGQPPADQHFDARGLANPDRGPRRHLTGLDARLRSEVMRCHGAAELLEKIRSSALERASASGGAPVTLAVGCAWGKHRSVTLCEEAARSLRGARTSTGQKLRVRVTHREQDTWSKKCPGRRWSRRKLDSDMCEEGYWDGEAEDVQG